MPDDVDGVMWMEQIDRVLIIGCSLDLRVHVKSHGVLTWATKASSIFTFTQVSIRCLKVCNDIIRLFSNSFDVNLLLLI
jgi:hypothetical protein